MRRKIPNSASTSVKSDTTCSTPRPVRPIASRDADELVGFRGERRRELARARAVVHRARGREAERAGLDRLPRRARPSAAMSSAWRARGARRARPSRSVAAPRAAPAARRRCRTAGRRARRGTRGTTASSTSRPSCSTVPGMSSTPSISSMRRSWSSGVHGCEADAAVADDDRRDAVPRRRDHARVPRRLAVVVAVDVDEAGRDEQPVGVDDALRRFAVDRADGR